MKSERYRLKLRKLTVTMLLATVILIGTCTLLLCACDGAKNYNVEYRLNGGYADGLLDTVNNSNTYYLPQASKADYRFCGWYEDQNFTGSPVEVIPKGNTQAYTLYAKFLKLHTATYFTDGGSHTNEISYTREDVITLKSAAKAEYSFRGWYTDPNFSGESVQSIENLDTDIDLYAKFSLLHYIEYDLQGGINNANNPRAFCEDEQIILYEPTKLGHSFVGWYSDNNKRLSVIQFGTSADVQLQAKWEIANYRLTWDLKGGSSLAIYPTQYTYGVGIGEDKFVFPTKSEMVFAGWYVDRNGKSEHIKSILETDIGNMVIYAKWVNAVCVNSVPQWDCNMTTLDSSGNAKYVSAAQTITVPAELFEMYNEGRLGIEISATFYCNVRSQGDATGTVTSYLLVNGKEYYVSSASKKGGGYSYWNGFWTVPQNGDWGNSGNQTKNVNFLLTSTEVKIGYRYAMSSNKTNDKVETSLKYGCTKLTCKYYIV